MANPPSTQFGSATGFGGGTGFAVPPKKPSTEYGSATGFNGGWGAPVSQGPDLAMAGAMAGAGGRGETWSNPQPGGLQQGGAQGHLSSLNTSGPGAAETNWTNNEQIWNSPTYGETNAQGLVSQFSDPSNRVQTSQNSQNWMNQFTGAMPSISTEPGFGAYFDNAKNRAAESINQTMAARGAYGSSAANDQISRAYTDLEGQRALKEADYNLQRLGEQRAWQGLGGQFAGQADTNSLQRAEQEKSWAQTLGQLGLDASQLGLGRLNASQDAAISAQNANRTRGQDYFGNQLALNDRIADLIKSIMGPAIDNDGALAMDASSGGVAEGNAALANEQANSKATADAAKAAWSIYTDPNAKWNKE